MDANAPNSTPTVPPGGSNASQGPANEPPPLDGKLAQLLLNLNDMEDEQAIATVRREYARLYLDRPEVGERRTHDGQLVLFFGNQFDHAFFTTGDRVNRLYGKTAFSRARGERIRWIKAMLEGEIDGVGCWRIRTDRWQEKPKPLQHKRGYIHWDTGYIIWLEPRNRGGWKFSSAYVAGSDDLRRYARDGFKVWEKKTP